MSTSVYTIITAAGNSTRTFLDAGFPAPKNLLVVDGSAILSRAVSSYTFDVARTTVALNKDECLNWPTATNLLEEYPEISVQLINSNVPGALVSAIMSAGAVPKNSPLVVAAGDSEINGGVSGYVQKYLDSGTDAGTIVFPSSETRWSYIATSEKHQVRQIAEKRVIGSLATTGVFYFRTAELFLSAAQWCLVNNSRDRNLFYVSTVLNALIVEGMKVKYMEIPRNSYRSWSLPSDITEYSG